MCFGYASGKWSLKSRLNWRRECFFRCKRDGSKKPVPCLKPSFISLFFLFYSNIEQRTRVTHDADCSQAQSLELLLDVGLWPSGASLTQHGRLCGRGADPASTRWVSTHSPTHTHTGKNCFIGPGSAATDGASEFKGQCLTKVRTTLSAADKLSDETLLGLHAASQRAHGSDWSEISQSQDYVAISLFCV